MFQQNCWQIQYVEYVNLKGTGVFHENDQISVQTLYSDLKQWPTLTLLHDTTIYLSIHACMYLVTFGIIFPVSCKTKN